MARFTFHTPGHPGVEGYVFVAWDELRSDATEATKANQLGKPMPESMARLFEKMEGGTRHRLPSGNFLMKEY